MRIYPCFIEPYSYSGQVQPNSFF